MTPRLQDLLTELDTRLRALYGKRLERLVLFGSQARGDAEPGSDIDVLVVLRGIVTPSREIARTGEVCTELSLKYNVVVSCLFVSARRFSREKSPLLLNVRKEGVAI